MMHCHHSQRHAAAFTLMEVLIAIGLFALGFVAVASIFPAGALLQRNSSLDAQGRMATDSAKTVISTLSLRHNHLTNGASAVEEIVMVQRLHTNFIRNSGTYWTESLRSLPSASPVDDRSFYWIPLIRASTPLSTSNPAPAWENPPSQASQWEIYIFVLRRERGSTVEYAEETNSYPSFSEGERSSLAIPCLNRVSASQTTALDTLNIGVDRDLQPGDPILLSGRTGDVTRTFVKLVTPSTGTIQIHGVVPNGWSGDLWYAPAPAGRKGSSAVTVLGPFTDLVRN